MPTLRRCARRRTAQQPTPSRSVPASPEKPSRNRRSNPLAAMDAIEIADRGDRAVEPRRRRGRIDGDDKSFGDGSIGQGNRKFLSVHGNESLEHVSIRKVCNFLGSRARGRHAPLGTPATNDRFQRHRSIRDMQSVAGSPSVIAIRKLRDGGRFVRIRGRGPATGARPQVSSPPAY